MISQTAKVILTMNLTGTRDAVVTTLNEAQTSLLATDHTLRTITETEDVGVGRPSTSNGPKTIATVATTAALGANVPTTTGTAPKGSVGAPVIAGTAHEIDVAEVTTTAGIAAAVAEIRETDEVTAVIAEMATATNVTTGETVAAATEIAAAEVATADANGVKTQPTGSPAPYVTTFHGHKAFPSPQRNQHA